MKIAPVLPLLLLAALPPLNAQTLADLATQPDAARLQGVQAQAQLQHAADGVAQRGYVFQPGPRPQLVVQAPAAGWHGAAAGALTLRVQNGMGWLLGVEVDLQDANGKHLRTRLALPPGPPQWVRIPLQAVSPRAMGMQVGPPMPWQDGHGAQFVATTVEGAFDAAHLRSVALSIPAPAAPQTLLLGQLSLQPDDPWLRAAYTGIVDRWGQYTRREWPEKVSSDAQLKASARQERQQLAQWLGQRQGLDPYGGRLQGPALQRTGWFHTQQQAGRWYLVSPDGHAFFSIGLNAVVADGARTYVQGREFMFRDLPAGRSRSAFYGEHDSRNPDASSRDGIGYNHGRWFDFYAANLYRVDGAGWLAAWRQRTLDRLQAWGFNTLGNWSDPSLAAAHRVAYTVPINIDGAFGTVSSGFDYWGRMPDPFDPRFAQAAERAVAQATAGKRDDPWLLGYFADNELAWAGVGPQGRWGLAQGSLRGQPVSAAKQAFIAELKARYGSIDRLNAAWGLQLADWSALQAEGFRAPDPSEAHPAIAEDYSRYLRDYADEYFRIVAAAIRRHDPHHLFLGGRFAVNTPEAVAGCARYCDVVSFNTYTDTPQHGFDVAALRQLGKPVLITEFHFGSDDRGPFGKGVASVYTEAQRGAAYARFLQAAAGDPTIVGAHWFQYTDQPVTGRLLDGENAHIGLVGITDLPFVGFVEAVRRANLAVP